MLNLSFSFPIFWSESPPPLLGLRGFPLPVPFAEAPCRLDIRFKVFLPFLTGDLFSPATQNVNRRDCCGFLISPPSPSRPTGVQERSDWKPFLRCAGDEIPPLPSSPPFSVTYGFFSPCLFTREAVCTIGFRTCGVVFPLSSPSSFVLGFFFSTVLPRHFTDLPPHGHLSFPRKPPLHVAIVRETIVAANDFCINGLALSLFCPPSSLFLCCCSSQSFT